VLHRLGVRVAERGHNPSENRCPSVVGHLHGRCQEDRPGEHIKGLFGNCTAICTTEMPVPRFFRGK
jgi:hypothetical protein